MSRVLKGRYELVDRIGEGGMAVVYKAKDRLLNRFVAVKILRPEFTKDAQFIDSFRKESQAAAGLQHPNIVAVYDVGQEGDIYFIVMELVDGIALSEYIKQRAPLDYREVVRITKQVAQALSVAHHHNIIHRDIKPHNIMLTKDGTAKLGDFGIAKAVSDATLTSTSTIIGSVHYFSPEQARGTYVDELSDIYSLGIIMYEMLTGRVPFDGDNPVQVALMHINNNIPAPSQIVPGIPPALEKIVMKAANRFQSDRYKNVDLMIEDLNSVEYIGSMMGNEGLYAAGGASQATHAAPVSQQPVREERPQRDSNRYEEDYDDRRNTHRKKDSGKKKLVIALVALLAVIGIGGFAILKSGLFGGVQVPEVTGMTYSEAKAELEEQGFTVREGDPIPSETVEEGYVAKQTPDAGKRADKGSKVTIYLSSGKSNQKVPKLIGKYYDKSTIKDLLEANGYTLGEVTEEESDKYQKGYIIDQTPSAGTKDEKGTAVDIVVSKGNKDQQEIAVPYLTGTYDQASVKKQLEDEGLALGSVSQQYSSVHAKGTIISQSPSAGTKVNKGTSVNLIISLGPEPSSSGSGSGSGSGDSGSGSGTGGDSGTGGGSGDSDGGNTSGGTSN